MQTLIVFGMFSSLFQLITVDYDYLRRQIMQSEQNRTGFVSIVFDFVLLVRSVRKSNSHKIRCPILFNLRTRSNTNRSIRVRSVFCSILFDPIRRDMYTVLIIHQLVIHKVIFIDL